MWKHNKFPHPFCDDPPSPKSFYCEDSTRQDRPPKYNLLADALGCGPGPRWHSKQDITTLISLQSTREAADRSLWYEVAKSCLSRTCNSDLLPDIFAVYALHCHIRDDTFSDGFTDFFDCFPFKDEPGYRSAFDHSCAMCLQQLLPVVAKVFVDTQQWKEAAFVEVSQMLQMTSSLQEVKVNVPSYFLEDEDQPSSSTVADWDQVSVQENNSTAACAIESFGLFFEENDEANPSPQDYTSGKIAALRLLPCMPRLTLFEVRFKDFPLEVVSPYLVQMVQHAQGLHVADVGATVTPPSSHVLPTLQALRCAPSVFRFSYKEPKGDNFDLHKKKLEKTLQEQTSLREVQLKFPSRMPVEFSHKMNFYLDTNSFGRSTARDPTTDNETYVELLAAPFRPTKWFQRFQQRVIHRATTVQCALLRELPGLWSRSALGTGPIFWSIELGKLSYSASEPSLLA